VDLCAREERRPRVHRIVDLRNEHDVSAASRRGDELRDALLCPGEREHLGCGVGLNAESVLHEPRDRLEIHRHAAKRRVAMRGGVGSGSLHRFDDRRWGRPVGASDTEVVERHAALPSVGLEPVELREDVRRQRVERFAQTGNLERRRGHDERKLSHYGEPRSAYDDAP
jgi:hypothetical protein